MMDGSESLPKVGIFWMVGGQLVAAGCSLEEAERVGDWVDYPGGHADYWERWQEAGRGWLVEHGLPLDILSSEYDEHPRGRIVFDHRHDCFFLYADLRIQTATGLQAVKRAFGLEIAAVKTLSDPHYR